MSKEMVGNCIKHKSCLNMPFHTEKCETCGSGMKNFRELKLTSEDVEKLCEDNNPSPKEALEILIDKIDNPEREIVWNKTFNAYTILQKALTNYANMVEKYDKALKYLCDNMDCPIELIKDDSFCEDNCGWKPNHSPCWDRYFEQDITKVLEGKINE
jgi:hypothetical protein